jgi:hypothetical protein
MRKRINEWPRRRRVILQITKCASQWKDRRSGMGRGEDED